MRIRAFAAIAATLLALIQANGQDFRTKIENDPNNAGGIYRYYAYTPEAGTPAPKGYKPFYISHYGRHGSRYHSHETSFRALPVLEKADSLGILTEYGKELLGTIRSLHKAHEGNYGMITPRGAEEQRGIASRMYKRAPEVFSGKYGRTEIAGESSTYPRCLMSMAAFCLQLQKMAPSISLSLVTGEGIKERIAKSADLSAGIAENNRTEERFRKEGPAPDRFIKAIFSSDPAQALGAMSERQFMGAVYEAGATGMNTDLRLNTYGAFTTDELVNEWKIRNIRTYILLANCETVKNEKIEIAKSLLKEILESADKAVADGSKTAADIRFGHDSSLLPLAWYIGLKGISDSYSIDTAHEHWDSSDYMCMATNLQFIFYRNKKGDVLVKALYNEKETAFEAVPSFYGPYCRWEDLRSHLAALL